METLVINLYGGPGIGKSTTAARVFSELKYKGINSELVREFAKDLVWQERLKELDDQLYILAKQNHRMTVLKDKVDVIITDSPLLLSMAYNNSAGITAITTEVFNKYNNMNFLLRRVKPYYREGRVQTSDEAIEKDMVIKNILDRTANDYKIVEGDESGVKEIVYEIMKNPYIPIRKGD